MTTRTTIKQDMEYGQIHMITCLPDEDSKQNTDVFFKPKYGRGIRIAYRTRRYKLSKFNEISIRAKRRSGTETELSKILNNKSKADLYIFEFRDSLVICTLRDIKRHLKEHDYRVLPNRDKTTEGAYININKIPHLLIPIDVEE